MPFASQLTTILALLLPFFLPQGLERNDTEMKGRSESPDGLTSRDLKLLWRSEKSCVEKPTELCSLKVLHPSMLVVTRCAMFKVAVIQTCIYMIRQWPGCWCIYCSYADGVRWKWLIWLVCVSGQQSMLWQLMHRYIFASDLKEKKRKKVLNVFSVNTLYCYIVSLRTVQAV